MSGGSEHEAGATDGRAGGPFDRPRRRLSTLILLVACCLIAALALGAHRASAQSSGSSIEQVLQTLQGQSGGSVLGSQGPTTTPTQTILQPTTAAGPPLPPSRLEQIMSARAGIALKQFGYDQFGQGQPVAIAQMGGVQNSYILGPGDDIIVSLRGQENSEYRTTVDRNGNVVLPRLSPIPAAGRTLGQFMDDLVAAVRRAYVSTQAFVSLGNLRQIGVTITGEVNNPGLRIVTGLSTAADAILISGGVKKTGSLRNIRIVRGGREIPIDLYAILTQRGGNASVNLVDGDRIIVPPLGRTVAIAGWVRRPGIFELAPGQSAVSARELIALGGGLEVRGKYRLAVLRIRPDGQTEMADLTTRRGSIRDSEILFALPDAQQTEGRATLSGGSALAGPYAVNSPTKLSDLLRAPGALGDSPYTLFGIVVRKDPKTLLKTLTAISPVAVVNGKEDLDLESDDVVRIFSVNESRLLFAVTTAFQQRRVAAEAALRAPRSVGEQTAGQYASPLLQGQDNSPNSEQKDIGELSKMVLTDTGLVPEDQLVFQNGQYVTQTAAARSAVYPSPQQTIAPGAQQFMAGSNSNPVQPGYAQLQNSASGPVPQMQAPYGMQQGAPNAPLPYAPGAYFGVPQGAPNAPLPYTGTLPSGQSPPLAPNMEQPMVGPNQVPTNQDVQTFGDLSRQLGIDPLVLVHFMIDHQVTLRGAVRGPGDYLVGPAVSLQDLVTAAGGTAGWADGSGVELITTQVDTATGRSVTRQETLSFHDGMLANYIVQPHDDLHFNQIYTVAGIGSITLQGEVRRPGVYQLVRGEHLSDVLQQAGGLTDVAYPYGAVFLRRSAADIEREGYRREASEIQDQLLLAMTRASSTEKLSPEGFTAAQSLVNQLRTQTPLGRMSIVADPVVLATKPQLDPLLEPGDVLYVPQRPSTVSVLGEVMQPGSYLYSPSRSPSEYIDQAGGYTSFADDGMTFVVLPDGTAHKVETSWLDFNGDTLPPGSAVVVPRDLSPFDMRQFVIDASQIFSQLAISAASIAVLSRNN